MTDKADALARILDGGVVAIFRAAVPAGLVEAAAAVVKGGITAVEFTCNTPDYADLVSQARARLDGRALVGAGTVLTTDDACRALEAGAQFIVMPGLDRGVIEAAQSAGVPVMPGAFTPTEIITAWQWGADLVKLFPASAGGPGYLKAIRAPLPHIPLVPTGGVSAANARDYIRAGAAAVAVGGSLADPAVIAARQFGILTEAAQTLLAIVRQAREEQRK